MCTRIPIGAAGVVKHLASISVHDPDVVHIGRVDRYSLGACVRYIEGPASEKASRDRVLEDHVGVPRAVHDPQMRPIRRHALRGLVAAGQREA